MLSIKFGYGRPAALARALADFLRLTDKSFGLPRSSGRFLSQTGFTAKPPFLKRVESLTPYPFGAAVPVKVPSVDRGWLIAVGVIWGPIERAGVRIGVGTMLPPPSEPPPPKSPPREPPRKSPPTKLFSRIIRSNIAASAARRPLTTISSEDILLTFLAGRSHVIN